MINKTQGKLKQNTNVINDFEFVLNQFREFSEFIEIYDSLNDKEINELVLNILELKKNVRK